MSGKKPSVREEEVEPRRDHRLPASAPSVVQSVPTNILPSVSPSVPDVSVLQEQYQAEMEQQIKHQVYETVLSSR